jgi:hypothetical protein
MFLLQQWDKIEDKYAATSLGVAAFIALWSTTGMISVILIIFYLKFCSYNLNEVHSICKFKLNINK